MKWRSVTIFSINVLEVWMPCVKDLKVNATECTPTSICPHHLQENKARWKKKINGEDLTNDEGHREIRIGSDGRDTKGRGVFERSDADAEEARRKRDSKSRKYALYWDQTDDPSYNGAAAATSGERHNRRPVEDHGGRNAPQSSVGDERGAATNMQATSPYRRKRFDDLKSMQQRKKDADEADQAFNYGWVDY